MFKFIPFMTINEVKKLNTYKHMPTIKSQLNCKEKPEPFIINELLRFNPNFIKVNPVADKHTYNNNPSNIETIFLSFFSISKPLSFFPILFVPTPTPSLLLSIDPAQTLIVHLSCSSFQRTPDCSVKNLQT